MGGKQEDMFARHSKETGVFCEVNNMNKDNLHFLLFSNTFLFFFFFALLEWEDSIGLMFVNDKIMSLLLKIAKMTYTTYVCVYLFNCGDIVILRELLFRAKF